MGTNGDTSSGKSEYITKLNAIVAKARGGMGAQGEKVTAPMSDGYSMFRALRKKKRTLEDEMKAMQAETEEADKESERLEAEKAKLLDRLMEYEGLEVEKLPSYTSLLAKET
eukprot:TRINITY_DN16755_c0_g1_i1.p1 TRINITY_DN16755_c0_g1~~TRINITY_DN16755_c0_g1_i1.p1  ORF type:complete len:112 (-),score=27.96 TRINITY_DN16755_c0_g1_i1:552-887(-)